MRVDHAIHMLCRFKQPDAHICEFDKQRVAFALLPIDPDTDKEVSLDQA